MEQIFVAATQIPHRLPLLQEYPCSGHFFIEKTYHSAQERFFWRGMKRDVWNWVDSCDQCLRGRKRGKKTDTISQHGSLVNLFGKYFRTYWDPCLFRSPLVRFF